MTLRLIQLRAANGDVLVAASADGRTRRIRGADSTLGLAHEAIESGASLSTVVNTHGFDEEIDLAAALEQRRILPPIAHQDPARVWLTGTGLTHLGSADARDRMHAKAHSADASDSMRMFRMGLEGGKAAGGGPGVQPEWFYKGDGRSIVAPEAPLTSPQFALDGGEEPELAGIYVIAQDGTPFRLGFCLANEFSDHIMERMNYLYLAHSKLRPASIGPELLLGELPADIRGSARVRRGTETIWEKPFLTGENNMSHYVRNLEHHHFKYSLFRRPGDVHVHFFGTATLSFSDGIKPQDGDVFEIEAAPFGLPLRNPLQTAAAAEVTVRVL
ncbi:MAG: hypothetical protein M3O41_08565 [Pseudomonadota bacterium]|nr:hypothetical protein [Pseudomonadota bacterium]